LIDIPRALEGRSYRAEGRVVFGVHDPFMPDNDGRYLLEAGPGGAKCSRTSDDADLELDVNVLGALYLGGQSISPMARAGWVRGKPESLATTDAMFAWDPQPWCTEVF
jgi:predicted acetyltransferase